MYQRPILLLAEKNYQYLFKPLAFKIDPEVVHNRMSSVGEWMGGRQNLKKGIGFCFSKKYKILSQNIFGINFESPIGLSAGFDYEARLTQITPALGFGFHTVGTITNGFYQGNPAPLLGRLPKSRSLMVNKGFKNQGAVAVVQKLKKYKFDIPLGISIGRTNNPKLSQGESVKDIIKAFETFEKNKTGNSYYELNISCPNLYGSVSFYTPQNLKELLRQVDKLNIKKPIFLKMPISLSNKEILLLLESAARHSIKGVIFGNLQSNRSHPSLYKDEVKKFKVGNFSGKPTFERSNELIELSYKKYKKRFVVIGTGGVFSAEDAYEKIKKGASLVQLITGMIFQGPQLISQINYGLADFLKKDGFKNISEAIGSRISG